MELTLTRQTPAQHIVWLDVVRLVAMFTVVCCHCTDPFNSVSYTHLTLPTTERV